MPDQSQVVSIKAVSRDQWEKDLNEFRYSTFHHPQWIEAVCQSKDLKDVYFDFFIAGEKVAKISGIRTARKYMGTQLFFYAGPALKEDDVEIYSSCLLVLKQFAISIGFSKVIVGSYGASYAPHVSLRPYYSVPRKEYLVKLDEEFANRYNRNFKRKIKKASTRLPQFEVDVITVGELMALLESTRDYRLNRKKEYILFAVPHVNEHVLEKLHRRGYAHIYSLKLNNRLACALITFEEEQIAAALHIGTDQQFYEYGPTAFTYDGVFRDLFQKGLPAVYLGGVPLGTDGVNLSYFKRSLGAEASTVYNVNSDFLNFPYTLFNPLFAIGRKLPRNSRTVQSMKRLFYKLF